MKRTIRALSVRRIVVASIAAAALLMHVGCGGGSEEAVGSEEAGRVEPEVWLADICVAIRDLQMSLGSREREVADEARAATSAKQAKAVLVSLYASVLDDIDAFLEKVDAAGTPTGEQGEVPREFRNRFGQLRQVFADALVQIRGLPTRNVSAFNSQVAELDRSTDSAAEEVWERPSPDLQDLELEGEPPEACRELLRSG
jgi:hypothetical protein